MRRKLSPDYNEKQIKSHRARISSEIVDDEKIKNELREIGRVGKKETK